MRIACHDLSRTTTGECSPARPYVVLIPLNLMVCDRPHHVLRGTPTGKLQRPVQLHKRGSRTNEDATPVLYAASSEAAPTWCGPRQATARMSWLPVTIGPPPPEQEPPSAPCNLAGVQGVLFLSSCARLRHHPCQQLHSAVGRHLELQTPKWCPQQAAPPKSGHNLQIGCRGQSSQVRVSHAPPCHSELRFVTRSPFSPALLTVSKLHGGGQRRRVDGHTGRCAWSKTKEGKGDVGEGPGREQVPTVSQDKGVVENGIPATGPLCDLYMARRVGLRKQDGRCAIVASNATGSLVLPSCPLGNSCAGLPKHGDSGAPARDPTINSATTGCRS